MRFYAMKDVAWAQVQATGASLQVGGRIWGIEPAADWRNWQGWGPIAVIIWSADLNCGMRTIFEIRLGRMLVRWKSRGETVPGHYRWDERGWQVRLLAKRPERRSTLRSSV